MRTVAASLEPDALQERGPKPSDAEAIDRVELAKIRLEPADLLLLRFDRGDREHFGLLPFRL